MVNWDESEALALLLGYDLPTEIEWEIAARGKEGREHATSNDQIYDDSEKKLGHFDVTGLFPSTVDVGSYSPIQIGGVNVFDLLGNVWEWTRSLYRVGESDRVARGAAYNTDPDPVELRAARRFEQMPYDHSTFFGFRLRCGARTLAAA